MHSSLHDPLAWRGGAKRESSLFGFSVSSPPCTGCCDRTVVSSLMVSFQFFLFPFSFAFPRWPSWCECVSSARCCVRSGGCGVDLTCRTLYRCASAIGLSIKLWDAVVVLHNLHSLPLPRSMARIGCPHRNAVVFPTTARPSV